MVVKTIMMLLHTLKTLRKYPVFLRKDEWEDVIDFIGITSFAEDQTDELHAYGIQLIEAIKEQVYES